MRQNGTKAGTGLRIEAYEYAVGPGAPGPSWQGWGESDGAEEHGHARPERKTVSSADFERQLAEQTRRSFEEGRARGLDEGRLAEREAQCAARQEGEKQRAREMAGLVGAFAQERERYLGAVEREVVELALAVAARILRREAQMDPLLLTGAVRVALGQLSASTEVRLRVPDADLGLWRDAIALLPNLNVKPVVEAGEGMRLGDCVVETALGSVDLGVRSQLGEIERGFFDRAAAAKTEPAEKQEKEQEKKQEKEQEKEKARAAASDREARP
ncbi:MAG: FliH/SctL family protein [Terracidiphilus sp.]